MSGQHLVNSQKDGLDSFWKIADHYEVSFQELKQINNGKGTEKGRYPYEKRHPPYGLNNGDVVILPAKQPPNKKHGDCVGRCEEKLKEKLEVVTIALQTEFSLCEPAIFRVTQYKGTPTEADKKRIKWMIQNAKTKKNLKSVQGVIIKEKGEELIIECVPFEWRDQNIEVAAQFDTSPQEKLIEKIPISAEIFDWIATIEKAELAYPAWSGVEMTNAMRRLAGYDDEKFQKMYDGSPPGKKLKPNGKLTNVDIENLERWTRHSNVTTGIVKDCNGDMIAAGHVLTGISAGVYRNKNVDITPWYSFGAGEKMDNLYAVTISGDLGQVAVFVNEDKQKKPYIGNHGDADEAEIIGDIDGFNLGFNEPRGGSGKKLSQILLEYYCSCKTEGSFRKRTSLFESNDDGNLEDQVRRFANTYVYASEGKFDGLFSEVDTEANEASAEFRRWMRKRKSIEERLEKNRLKQFEEKNK